MKLPFSLALTGFLAAACSSSADTGPAAPPLPAEKPVWNNAPSTLELREGIEQSVALTITARDRAKVKIEVAAPEGVDARVDGDKLMIRADYNLGELEPVSITLDDGERTTISVGLNVKRIEWVRRQAWTAAAPSMPVAREHGVFFLDADSRVAYMFEGSGFKPQWEPLADSWKFEIGAATWAPWTPNGDVPDAVAAGRVAQVRGKALAYFSGGYHGFGDTETAQTDLFRVDVTTGSFTKLVQNAGPVPRQLHLLAHDGVSDRLIAFGGYATDDRAVLGDTWLAKVDGTRAEWSKLASGTSSAPSPRYGAFYGIDSELRRLVVWSGGQTPKDRADMVNAASDAWALDLSSEPPQWRKLSPAGTTPRGRRNGCSMYDPIGHRLFVFGGTPDGSNTETGLFVLDVTPGREKWTKLARANEPPGRSSGFGFVDAAGNGYCGFGNDDLAYTDMNVIGYAP